MTLLIPQVCLVASSLRLREEAAIVLSPLSVSASELVIGQAYFLVTYADTAMVLPIVHSIVYVGKNLDGEKEDALYFQDVMSYARFGAYPNLKTPGSKKKHDAKVIVTESPPPPNLFRIDGLVDEISRAEIRLHKRGGTPGDLLEQTIK